MVLGRVAVTGASGMLGWHLLEVLQNSGISCVASSRRRPQNLPAGSSWFAWDMAQWKSTDELDRLFDGAEALLHLGAAVPGVGQQISREIIFDINVRATLCLGEWALRRGIPLVYLSGSTVYADPERAGIRETDAKSSHGFGGFYGSSKLFGEEVLSHLAGEGLKLSVIRPSSLYGFGLSPDKMLTKFLLRAAQGGVIELAPPADDRVDLIHAADVAEALLQAVTREAWGVFNVASEAPCSVEEIAQTCVQTVGCGRVEILPALSVRTPLLRFALNCGAARMAFGFAPRLDLKAGIGKMWLDMQEHKRVTL